MSHCGDIEVIDIEKDNNEEDIQVIEPKENQNCSEREVKSEEESNDDKNQESAPSVTTVDDDSDSDNDCTLASLAKSAKAEKLKQEASKLGAKPLTDLFSENAHDSQQPVDTEMEERKRKAIELRRQAEERRAEERKQREEEKRKKEEEKLQKQQETERAKAEKEEAKRLALEKKAEEKRMKEEEKAKKDDDKQQKQKHLDFQKIEKDAARKVLEEKLAEERKKREEQKEEERKKKEAEKQQKELERLQKEQERMQKEREKHQKEKEKQAKEQERQQKLKDMEKQRVEKEEAKKMAEDEKKKAEEKENLKRQKQKQFFGSFFKSPASSSGSAAVRRISQGEGLGNASGGTGEGSANDADVLEVLPNGQVKPIIDENKPTRRYIGPFVAFEPLPGMKIMPHRRRPQLNIEEFDDAFAKQEHNASMATTFDKSRKRITRRNIHRLVRDYSEDEKNGVTIEPCLPVSTDNLKTGGLRIRMLKDASFVGYLRELVNNEESSTAENVNTSAQEKSEPERVPATPEKPSELNDEKKSKDVDIHENTGADDDSEVRVIEAAKEGGSEITVIDDSVVMIEDSKDGATDNIDQRKQAEEVFELQKLIFKDIKELDVFLLQPTNSGSRKFMMKGKYIRIRHDGEDKSWLDYFGSWRKLPGSNINLPRRPVIKIEKFFDYNEEDDFYSDVEEAGESVDDSGDDVGSGGDSENEYDYEDEGFLVPHGYLSEEEGGEGDTQDTENYKKQTKEWEARFKKKCVKMVPRMVGPFYGEDKPAELLQFSAVFLCDTSAPIQVFSTDDEQCRANKDKLAKKKTGDGENVVTVIPKAAMPSLIRLVHGNTKGLKILVEEFRTFWMKETETLESPQGDNLSKKKLEIKILSMADREKREKEFNKVCWYVSKEVLKQYRLSKLPVPNPSCVGQTLLTGKENQQKDSAADQEKGKTFDIAEPPSKRAKFAN